MTVNLFKNGTDMVQEYLAKFEGDFPAMTLSAQKEKKGQQIPHQLREAKPPPLVLHLAESQAQDWALRGPELHEGTFLPEEGRAGTAQGPAGPTAD